MRILHGISAFVPLLFAIFVVLMHIGIIPLINLPHVVPLIVAGVFFIGIILTLRSIYGQKKVSDEKKALWTMLMIVLNVIILPIFWLIYIYPAKPKKRKHKPRKK